MVNINLSKIAETINRLPISQSEKDQLLEMYETRLNNYYNLKYLTPRINKSKDIKKFSCGYFFITVDEKYILIAKIYLKNDVVRYEILKKNLPEINMSFDEIELNIISHIYTPLSIDDLDFISSIFTSKDCHFHYLEKKLADNPSGIRFRPYFIIQ